MNTYYAYEPIMYMVFVILSHYFNPSFLYIWEAFLFFTAAWISILILCFYLF
jgi:hypothetical protein